MKKITYGLLLFFAFFCVSLGFAFPSFAQQCASSVRVDSFSCKAQTFNGEVVSCSLELNQAGGTASCNTNLSQNPNCESNPVCSSNDTCTVHTVWSDTLNRYFGDGCSFSCTSSPAHCWVNSSPVPTGGGGGGCSSDYCAGADQCFAQGGTTGAIGPRPSGGNCAAGTTMCCVAGGGGGPGGASPTPPPVQCGQHCNVDSDCISPSATGAGVSCRGNVCVNSACFAAGGTTIPGANCDCNLLNNCGSPCGAAVGLCQSGSTCTFVDGPACSGATYCVGTPTQGGYTRPACSTQNYLKGPTGQTSGFNQAQIQATCACTPPNDITIPLHAGIGNSSRILEGATINAATDDAKGLNGFSATINWGDSFSNQGYNGYHNGGNNSGSGHEPTANDPNLGTEAGVSGFFYDVEIVPDGKDCTDPNAICLHKTSIKWRSYSFAPKFNGKYQARVRIYNPSCDLASGWTPWSHFTVTGLPVSGTTYLDEGLFAVYSPSAQACYLPGTPGWPAAGSTPVIKVVNAPGFYGEYFNSYVSSLVGSGPYTAGTKTVNAGYGNYTYMGGTPRTRYDSAPNPRWPGGYHSLLNMQATNDGDGRGGAVRWTAQIMADKDVCISVWMAGGDLSYLDANSSNGTYGYSGGTQDSPNEEGSAWIVGALYGNGVLPNGVHCYNSYALQAGQVYTYHAEYYQYGYTSSPFDYRMTDGRYCTDCEVTAGSGTGIQAGAGSVVNGIDFGSGQSSNALVNATGNYSVNQEFTGTGTMKLTPGISSYSCSCPNGCTYGNLGPSNLPFYKDMFLKTVIPGWFQVMNGNIFAGLTSSAGVGIQSYIPAGCTSAVGCSPFVLTAEPTGAGGVPLLAQDEWKFDETSGTTVSDSAINNKDGTWNGSGSHWTTGKYAGGGAFNGSNDYVNVGNLGLSAPASITFWMNTNTTGSDDRILSQLSGATSQGGALRLSSGGIDIWDGSSWKNIISYGTLTTGTWYHIALVWNSATSVTAFVNGVPKGTISSAFNYSGPTTGIGAKFLNTYGTNFNGKLDEFKFFNRALSATEVQADFSTPPSGTPTGSSMTDSAGIALTGGSQIDTDAAAGNNVTKLEDRPSPQIGIGTSITKKEDYNYFLALYGLSANDITSLDDFDGLAGRPSDTNATKPTAAPRNTKNAYVTSGDLTISQNWNIASGEKKVIFVPGNLILDDTTDPDTASRKFITVADGGYLAFIVKGDIIIRNSVGYSTLNYGSKVPNLEGIYIASGTLSFEKDLSGTNPNRKFVGAGTFVGWGGVNLDRSFGTAANATTPGEYFIFRPDLVKNVPVEMTSANSNWQEVN